jgi:hypothetical protein
MGAQLVEGGSEGRLNASDERVVTTNVAARWHWCDRLWVRWPLIVRLIRYHNASFP